MTGYYGEGDDTEKFTKVVSNYLKKFNHPNDNIKQKIEQLY